MLAIPNTLFYYSFFAVFAVLFFICYDVYMFTSVISAVTRKPSNCTGLGLTISATSFTVKLSLTIIGTMTGIGYTLERKSLFYTLLYNLSFVSDWCACSWWNLSSNSRMVCTPITIYNSDYVNVNFLG